MAKINQIEATTRHFIGKIHEILDRFVYTFDAIGVLSGKSRVVFGLGFPVDNTVANLLCSQHSNSI